MYKLSQRSKDNMKGVHPDLIRVVDRAIELTKYDFGISASVRTVEQQSALLAKREATTSTMNSRHIPENNKCGVSCAIDFKVYKKGKVTWDVKYYRRTVRYFFQAAIELGVQVEAGILWGKPVDGPHIQLSWKDYP